MAAEARKHAPMKVTDRGSYHQNDIPCTIHHASHTSNSKSPKIMMIGRDGEFSTLMGVYEQEEATLANDYPLYVAIHPDQVTKIYGRVHVRVTFALRSRSRSCSRSRSHPRSRSRSRSNLCPRLSIDELSIPEYFRNMENRLCGVGHRRGSRCHYDARFGRSANGQRGPMEVQGKLRMGSSYPIIASLAHSP